MIHAFYLLLCLALAVAVVMLRRRCRRLEQQLKASRAASVNIMGSYHRLLEDHHRLREEHADLDERHGILVNAASTLYRQLSETKVKHKEAEELFEHQFYNLNEN